MNAPPPLPKSLMIERSLRCFVLGLFGLVPLLGLPCAIRAALESWRVQRHHRGLWNAAQPYLAVGNVLALIGLLLNAVALLLLIAGLMGLLFY